jgi:hypothetical protein
MSNLPSEDFRLVFDSITRRDRREITVMLLVQQLISGFQMYNITFRNPRLRESPLAGYLTAASQSAPRVAQN